MEERIKTLATLMANKIVSEGGADGGPIVGVDVKIVRDLIWVYYNSGEITRDQLLSAALKPYFEKEK